MKINLKFKTKTISLKKSGKESVVSAFFCNFES